MITSVKIENFKSIDKLDLVLGNVTVLIGANGSGKSNILEGITIGTTASSSSSILYNEFLANRGVRIADARLMRNAFDQERASEPIKISFKINEEIFWYEVSNNYDPDNPFYDYVEWDIKSSHNELRNRLLEMRNKSIDKSITRDEAADMIGELFKDYDEEKQKSPPELKDFIIYSPENNELRKFEVESNIVPLGVNGAGLFKLLKNMDLEKTKELKSNLKMIDWFEDFHISENLSSSERKIQLTDKYIDQTISYFDQRSSNEGFLFLLFYLSLFISKYTSKFFAIDNIDNALNPKLCRKLITVLCDLAKTYNKQVIFTTHNPAILDGLNLNDPSQKLYVVYRNKLGHTKLKPIIKKESLNGEEPVKLSEAFLRGYIGGLPKNF